MGIVAKHAPTYAGVISDRKGTSLTVAVKHRHSEVCLRGLHHHADLNLRRG